MERDFNGYMPPFMDYGMPPFGAPQDTNDPMLNPIMQYEHIVTINIYICKWIIKLNVKNMKNFVD